MTDHRLARREFVREMAALGAWPMLAASAWGRALREDPAPPGAAPRLECSARAISVSHYPELQEFIDGLRRKDKLSHHKVYRSYIDRRKFAVPETFPDAASVVVLAYRTPALRFDLRYKGRLHDLVLSPQYYDDGVTQEMLEAAVRRDIVKDPAAKLRPGEGLHFKLLAVRAGLGRYGRNNLCYVDGMGTYVALFAFLTNAKGLADSWRGLALLEECVDCPICYGICPTSAIRREEFVIDAGRCITLYNEPAGEFPGFILPSMHNALMGCMKCQVACPVNEKAGFAVIRGEEITEDETRRILEGTPDDGLLKVLGRKLHGFPPASDPGQFPILTRNLRALIHA